ncbi:MAG TPA: glucose 1-dehydrogenase [Steroidobacteraceae bacterium]|nr:glucose 1-dehydrogenase [Steroidobacteraceae bacterium]
MKTALVTGAASGLGQAIAARLAAEGAHVVVSDINVAAGQEVAKQLGGRAVFMALDTREESQWQRVTRDVLAQFGHLDILVNNAGVPTSEFIEDTTLERWRSVMAINLDGVFLGVKYGIEAMRKGGGGSIVNISSVAGLVGTPGTGTYAASKAGVRLLTKCAALECASKRYNIRVNSVHPGIVDTPMARKVFAQFGGGDEEAGRRMFVAMHPIGRMGLPDDVASGVLYLASEEASFVTGAELVIDGGMTAQ